MKNRVLIVFGFFAMLALAIIGAQASGDVERLVEKRSEVVAEAINNKTGLNLTGEDIRNSSKREEIKDGIMGAWRERNGDRSMNISGKNITLREIDPEKKELIAERINARTGLNLTAEDIDNKSALVAYLSNGRRAHIRTMPDTASEVALRRLNATCEERNCTLELKEVGNGNGTRAVYVVEAEEEGKAFLFFKRRVLVATEVDSETGQILEVRKPWWISIKK